MQQAEWFFNARCQIKLLLLKPSNDFSYNSGGKSSPHNGLQSPPTLHPVSFPPSSTLPVPYPLKSEWLVPSPPSGPCWHITSSVKTSRTTTTCFIYLLYLFFCCSTLSWRRQWHPTPVLSPGKSHGRRSLVGCSPWGHTELDTTERLHFHFSFHALKEMATQSSILAWRIPGTGEPGGLQSLLSQRVGYNLVTNAFDQLLCSLVLDSGTRI